MIMKKTLLIIFGIILLAISFTSCHKVESINEPQSALDYLTKHTWKGENVDMFKDGRYLETQKISQARLDFKESRQFFEYNNQDVSTQGSWVLIEGSPLIIKIDISSANQSVVCSGKTKIDLEVRVINDDYLSFSMFKTNQSGELIQYIYHFSK
jgi:hypothetical protein